MAHKKEKPCRCGNSGRGSRALLYLRILQPLPGIGAAAYSPVRRGPGDKSDWLVSIEGSCTDTPFRVLTLPTGFSPDAMWHAASTFAWRVSGCFASATTEVS